MSEWWTDPRPRRARRSRALLRGRCEICGEAVTQVAVREFPGARYRPLDETVGASITFGTVVVARDHGEPISMAEIEAAGGLHTRCRCKERRSIRWSPADDVKAAVAAALESGERSFRI